MENGPTEQRDLRSYLRPVLKRWWLIAAVVPLVTIGTYFYYDSRPKVYTASTELYVQPSGLNQILFGTSGGNQASIENLALLLQTRAVASEAAKVLAKEGRKPARGGVSARPLEESSFIVVTATAATPNGAARLANAYAKAFVSIQSRQLKGEAERSAETARKQLASAGSDERREAIGEKLQTLELVAAQPTGSVGIRQVEPALPPAGATDHDPLSHAIFALVVALMLSVGAAYGLDYMNRKLTRVEDVEDVLGLPLLTEVPKVDAPAPFDESGVGMAAALHEPFHRLQMNLDLLSRERPVRTILVASAAPGEGKSIVARNLALAFREAGRSVALLDADFRKATLGNLLAVRHGPGLADILAGHASLGQVIQEVPVRGANSNGSGGAQIVAAEALPPGHGRRGELAMVPAGEPHGSIATPLAAGEMRQTLETAARLYDTTVIDSPSILAVADVLPLLSEADAVVLVTRLGVTTRDSVRRALAELERISDVQIAGVVVNGIPPRLHRTRAYGYYYG